MISRGTNSQKLNDYKSKIVLMISWGTTVQSKTSVILPGVLINIKYVNIIDWFGFRRRLSQWEFVYKIIYTLNISPPAMVSFINLEVILEDLYHNRNWLSCLVVLHIFKTWSVKFENLVRSTQPSNIICIFLSVEQTRYKWKWNCSRAIFILTKIKI